MPNQTDLTLQREADSEYGTIARSSARKRERERVQEIVGPKEVGREGMLEKKRARREGDREFRNAKEDGGLEMDESILMGSGGKDSFKAQ